MGDGGSVAGPSMEGARGAPPARNRWAMGDRSRARGAGRRRGEQAARNRWAMGDRSRAAIVAAAHDHHLTSQSMGDGGSVAGGPQRHGAANRCGTSPSMGDGGSVAGMVEWARITCPALPAVLAIDGRWGIGRGVAIGYGALGAVMGPRNRWAMGDRSRDPTPRVLARRARLAIDGRWGIGRGRSVRAFALLADAPPPPGGGGGRGPLSA